ncbi:hypothetical protein KFK09_000719 [Dendrobium nobile]|uniref:Secreted protein n=1 Tax=Dendrobium nobile TaxID=94219 RepID=A0A8T3CBV8_DENNO|nr:hypothetical protein KFK09_000719 [Dendrobium nobile]
MFLFAFSDLVLAIFLQKCALQVNIDENDDDINGGREEHAGMRVMRPVGATELTNMWRRAGRQAAMVIACEQHEACKLGNQHL